MIEKKEPRQQSIETDLFDDDDIIDLTEEVEMTSEDGTAMIESKSGAAAHTAKISPLQEPSPSAAQKDTAATADGYPFTQEDEDIIAAAIDRLDTAENDEVEFEFDDDDDHFMGENQPTEGKEEFVALGDDDSMEMLEEADEFDFEEELDLEFETDDDESEIIAVSKDSARENLDITDEIAEELPISAEDDDRPEPEGDVPIEPKTAMDIFALIEEESLEPDSPADDFEFEESDLLSDDDDLDLAALLADEDDEDDDGITLAGESAAMMVGAEDELPEINEFDQHPAAEPDKLSETAAVFTKTDLEEEFLEPVEIKTGEPEKFSFDVATHGISDQIDGMDTLVSEESTSEPAVAFLPDEQAEQGERPTEGFQKGASGDALIGIIPEHLDSVIARLIDEKFSARIENIIYEAIAKAVSKEIDRLKEMLLENDSSANRL
jgi:hypothetical protein